MSILVHFSFLLLYGTIVLAYRFWGDIFQFLAFFLSFFCYFIHEGEQIFLRLDKQK
jgi:hypothetical protein